MARAPTTRRRSITSTIIRTIAVRQSHLAAATSPRACAIPNTASVTQVADTKAAKARVSHFRTGAGTVEEGKMGAHSRF